MSSPDTIVPAGNRTNPNGPPANGQHTNNWWLMLRKFLRQGKAIASFAPSSRWMARKMLSDIDFGSAKCIVELGAGTGPVTAELVKRVAPDCRLIIIERDPDFCTHLRKRFPGHDIVEGDASRFDEMLAARAIPHVDHILSGLPMPSLPSEVQQRVFEGVHRCLAPHGTYRQLTVMPWVYYRFYRRHFDQVRFKLVALNLPPGGTYVCRRAQRTKP
jgi:phospholipid N-methyltransferase